MPFWLVWPFFGSSYEATPHAEVRRLRTRFRLGPLSLLRWVFLPCPDRLSARCMASGADGCAFPPAFGFVFGHRVWYVLVLVYMYHQDARYPGGRTCFPAVLTYIMVDFCGKVIGFIAYLVVDPIWLLTSFTQGVVGCGFPAGRAISEIDDHQHTDRTTLPTCMLFLVQERGGANSRSSAEPWIVEFYGFPAKARGGKFPRSPAVVDSSTALKFNGTASRPTLWVDSPAGV